MSIVSTHWTDHRLPEQIQITRGFAYVQVFAGAIVGNSGLGGHVLATEVSLTSTLVVCQAVVGAVVLCVTIANHSHHVRERVLSWC